VRGAGGAIGIVEAGFVNPHSPFSIEVHGTKGSLFYGTPENKLLVRTGDDQAWESVEIPANRESAFEQWVGHVQNGTTADENIAYARELTM
ncbi:hypothetical protein ABTJ66_20420, partial [Acinetobacter baumannii]